MKTNKYFKEVVLLSVFLLTCLGVGEGVPGSVDPADKRSEHVLPKIYDKKEIKSTYKEEISRFMGRLRARQVTASQVKFFGEFVVSLRGIGDNTSKRSVRERRATCKSILNKDNYLELEDYFLESLESSRNDEDIERAIDFLARVLLSKKVEPKLVNMYNDIFDKATDDNPANNPPREIIFCVAEGLAYLGNDVGLVVFETVLESKDGIPNFQIRAMKALNELKGTIEIGKYIRPHLKAEHDALAYWAFQLLEPMQIDRYYYDCALHQFERLIGKLSDAPKMSRDQQSLLLVVATKMFIGLRDGKMDVARRPLILNLARNAIDLGDDEVQMRVAALFSQVAQDSDKERISVLLSSRLAKARSNGALAAANCGKEVLGEFVPVLLKMLEAENGFEKNFSLYALRVYCGEEKIGNYLIDMEFEKQKKEVMRKLGMGNGD